MKRLYILSIMALMLVTTNSAQAGWFGADWKPVPTVKAFWQELKWPLPSLCVGAKAGAMPDANLTTKGFNFKIPYLAVDVPFPSVTLGTKESRFTIGPNSSSKKDKK
jgi:hypothetical protein